MINTENKWKELKYNNINISIFIYRNVYNKTYLNFKKIFDFKDNYLINKYLNNKSIIKKYKTNNNIKF